MEIETALDELSKDGLRCMRRLSKQGTKIGDFPRPGPGRVVYDVLGSVR